MVIANPIYDVVFKRMMENDKVAKFFIGTLLDKVIETVEVKPQEFTYTDEFSALAVFRLDFLATIKTETGEFIKVLIEIQKAKNEIDLMRFRNYLAEQYKKENIIKEQKVILPITTIYILGFKLPEINTPCLKIERQYWDLSNKIVIKEKSEFVEKLTHDCYIVQVERITNRYQTKLDKLLSVFEQTNFVDDKKTIKEYSHQVDLEEVKLTTDILHYSGTNLEEKKKLEIEQEAWRTVDAMAEGLRQKVAFQSKILSEKELEINEKNKSLSEKDKEILNLKKQMEEFIKLIESKK
ncbi:MAG: hypothetical protein EAZ27_11660 [Cytophagales bacterium]|nr:MAG: hypothetical protein EAZ27_11660 [Cytophagales bacterium]